MRAAWIVAIACCVALACSAPTPRERDVPRSRPGPSALSATPSAAPSASSLERREPSQPSAVFASFTPPDAHGLGRAGELVYFEEVVGAAEATDRLPMLVLIHGRGDRPAPGWLPLQLPKPVRVIMPRAPLPHGDGFSWSRARAADAAGPSGAQLGEDLARMAAQIDAALAILRVERPTVGTPLIGGFSQGGMLSYTLAVRHPSACTLAIPISGFLPSTLLPAETPKGALPRIRALHGAADDVVPIEPARTAIAHLAKTGYDATLTEHPGVSHTITAEMLAQINAWLSEAL